MYDIKWIRENAVAFDTGLKRRGLAPLSASLLALDGHASRGVAKAQGAQERRNALSKEIGKAMGAKDVALAEQLKAEVAALKELQPQLEAQEKVAKAALDEQLTAIPNTPKDEVPDGADEHGNVVKSVHGAKPEETGKRLVGSTRPRNISSSARRSARWISRRRPSCRARVSSCWSARSRGSPARSVSSCSTPTPRSTAIPR